MSSPAYETRESAAGYVDLVMEGGGVRGIALVGALSVLEERGFQPQNLAGTSAGAVVATLYAAGYSADELYGLLKAQDFSAFLDGTWLAHLPLVGHLARIVFEKGINKGDAFLHWMQGLLAKKGVRTFGDLVHPAYADQPRYRYKVQMIASDLMGRRMLVLPGDATKLGIAHPDEMEVALAVRMSASLAFFFKPVVAQNAQTNREAFITDGGMLSDFPIWLFDSDGPPAWPTFGLKLVDEQPRPTPDGWLPPAQFARVGFVEYLKDLLATLMEAHDRYYLETDSFVRTIILPTQGVRATDFTISPEKAQALYEAGRAAAEAFLAKWNFAAYVEQFRMGKQPPSRRDQVWQAMKQQR